MIENQELSLEQIDSFAEQLLEQLKRPAMVCFKGDVGSGKTTLISKLVQLLGEETSSPTYSLIIEGEDFVHADFYRLEDAEELTYLELPLVLESRSYFFAEWACEYLDELQDSLPGPMSIYRLEIEQKNSSTRNYQLTQLK